MLISTKKCVLPGFLQLSTRFVQGATCRAHTPSTRVAFAFSLGFLVFGCGRNSRATDLLVNLNSYNGDHGRSTRARLFALTKSTDVLAMCVFLRTKALKKKAFFRVIPTLQFLKGAIDITGASANNDTPLNLIGVASFIICKPHINWPQSTQMGQPLRGPQNLTQEQVSM